MGHLRHLKREYRELAQRLDASFMPLPEPNADRAWHGWREILEILYSPQDAELAAKLPWRPCGIEELERRLGIARAELEARLDAMCDRGIVMDLRNLETGEVRYLLAPPLGGFLEFSMMRVNDGIPKKRMAEALDAYSRGDDTFAKELLGRPTRFGRALASERVIAEEIPDVLDWERASGLLESAPLIAVSLCFCRHTAEHLGRACDAPTENCLSLGVAADFIARRGFGRLIDRREALELLAQAREAGLVQIADNVQQRPVYLCNCCGCCCEQLSSINRWDLRAVNPSGFVPAVDHERCKGCSRCARACPIGAVTMTARRVDARRTNALVPALDAERCIGCGVCANGCKNRAMRMVRRASQPAVPQNALERVVRMAVERGQLGPLLVHQTEQRGAAFVSELLSALGKLPPVERALADEQVRSRFVSYLLGRGRRSRRRGSAAGAPKSDG